MYNVYMYECVYVWSVWQPIIYLIIKNLIKKRMLTVTMFVAIYGSFNNKKFDKKKDVNSNNVLKSRIRASIDNSLK